MEKIEVLRLMCIDFEKKYDHKLTEESIYEFWEKSNIFVANNKSNKPTYTIVMPPPNITGNLHIGHALDQTLQDVLIRYKRMNGFEVLYLPGTDHASIATEAKIVEKLKISGISKKDLTRNEFLKKAWEWKEEFGGNIITQVKKLGVSCDWSREKFTMDEACSTAVIEFFVKMYEEGLIYRGEKIVNWCPYCVTTISDAEVVYKESKDFLYTLKYEFTDRTGSLNVATTRPETIFGDAAVAVNPNDERYKKIIGKTVYIPLINREIKVVPDDAVDLAFGSGVLKVTPAHSYEDFEIGKRHNLPIISVMNETGILNDLCGSYKNIERFMARNKVVEDLKIHNLLEKKELITHNIGCCYRCDTVIEPMISTQWFLSMTSLAKPSIDVVKNGQIKFIPKRFENTHLRWMENIKDWCISRQLWWGHRIPAWHCIDCSFINVSRFEPVACKNCNSTNIFQDEDVLDTWFSSALWPFSTLGWPDENSPDFKFFPTNVLVTGYDIIFFWVSRMIFSSLKLTNKIPFEHVLIHGLVRDSEGRKMAKSLGNGIDPLDVIDEYGADVLRFTLITGLSPGNDTRFSKEKLEGSRNFLNKLWNSARFVCMYLTESNLNSDFLMDSLKNNYNIWIISYLNNVIKDVTYNFEKFEIGMALQKIYSFFWDIFCDWYLEFSKFNFRSEEKEKILETANVCKFVLINILKLLHPFIPFITEKIWKIFNKNSISISLLEFPKLIEDFENKSVNTQVDNLISVIKSIRTWRGDNKILSSKIISAYVFCESKYKNVFDLRVIKNLSKTEINFIDSEDLLNFENRKDEYFLIVTSFSQIYILIESEITQEMNKSIEKEIKDLNEKLVKYQKLLDNPEFLLKAPENVKKDTTDKLNDIKARLSKLS